MNLNKCLKALLLSLSGKYVFSLVEITNCRDNKMSKSYLLNYREKDVAHNSKREFKTKQDLVSWLSCLS